jgi:predicted kinase
VTVFHIVCGPPGSGKTGYVEQQRKWGDVIVDVDALYQAISGLPCYEKPKSLLDLVLSLRNALLTLLPRYQDRFYNAWIITGGARLESRTRLALRYDACGVRVHVLEVSPGECLRRIGHDPRRADKVREWQELVHKWWREYEPDESDDVVKPSWHRGGTPRRAGRGRAGDRRCDPAAGAGLTPPHRDLLSPPCEAGEGGGGDGHWNGRLTWRLWQGSVWRAWSWSWRR